MKRLIVRLSIVLLTFVIGLAAHSVWSKSGSVIEWCGEFILRGQD